MTRARLAVAILFLVTVGIWAYAGYAIGEAKGRGWRGAVIRNHCHLTCSPGTPNPGL